VRLWRAAGAAGWNTLRLDRWQAPPGLTPEEVVVYGGFFIALAEELGITLLEPRVDWLAMLPQSLTQRHVQFLTLAEARTLARRAFYKPSDDKCFLAKVYESGHQLPPAGELADNIPVLVSDIVKWDLEFRCYFLEGKLITLSPYLRHGDRVDTPDGEFLATDEEFSDAEAFANKLAQTPDIALPPGVVVDIGIIHNVGWAVIEANSAWAYGIYGCSASAILPILRRVCLPTATLSPQDAFWARQA